MKDLGETDVIPGVKSRKTENGFSLCQSHYIEKLLKRFDRHEEISVRTPYDPSICLKKNNGDIVSQAEYAKIIGSVMFLMNYTRPDIAYDVSRLNRYTHNPNKEKWDTLHRLFRYLKGERYLGNIPNKLVIARSKMEFQFIALELVGQEAEWLKNFVGDIPCRIICAC
ncbi:Retrovirus-related Pol polyprotein from transposon TNT 1-94 [Sesamum angolense]|uniref:Retrovirus-related Pol polyprotein from transposon TNT 1-94 n=1 Tax=Sesamum angolense TaxID=2727404 RepID=A0AAE1TA76_9LAMI|nr:Retrovirus-related Pol polyprotein from transposon TNT 1-94 [Sesamum angolense]